MSVEPFVIAGKAKDVFRLIELRAKLQIEHQEDVAAERQRRKGVKSKDGDRRDARQGY